MFGSTVLDVVIGLFAVYLVLALFVTSLGEAVSRLFQMRAGNLQGAVKVLLGHSAQERQLGNIWSARGEYSSILPTRLYSHPLLRGLARPRRFNLGLFCGPHGNGPSYLDRKVFSAALIDTVIEIGEPPASRDLKHRATVERFRESLDALRASNPEAYQSLTAMTRTSTARAALTAATPAAASAALPVGADELAALRGELEAWFDAAMDRASGWYKRKLQLILFLLGLGVAIAVNADTLVIVRTLAEDGPLRDAVAAQAAELVSELEAANASATPSATPGNGSDDQASPSATPATDASSSGSTTATPTRPPTPSEEVRTRLDEFAKLGLPIGWGNEPEGDWNVKWPPSNRWPPNEWSPGWFKDHAGQIVQKAFGIFLTSLALMLGAPFWFDTLKRLTNLRASGTPPRSGSSSP